MKNNIFFYNSKFNKKQKFNPINDKQISMYVCGPTVYNDIHVGNLRPIVVFDGIFRFLKYSFDDVVYVRNITDVDDKIIKKAREENISTQALVDKYIMRFHSCLDSYNILKPSFEPKATDFVGNMISFIQELLDKGFAYVKHNHVLFDSSKVKDYGSLSSKNLDELSYGMRVDIEDYKKNPTDFVLWKPSKDDEIFWPSPWGNGRMGWHIECSAMANSLLGDNFDIHGGGIDLLFPHHENERAQSCAKNGSDPANYWLHNGYINISNQKMSKSIGNVILAKDILKKFDANVIKFFIFSTHYRKPISWDEQLLLAAQNSFKKIKPFIKKDTEKDNNSFLWKPFLDALADDFNTPKAISEIFKLINSDDEFKIEKINFCFEILGFDKSFLDDDDLDVQKIESLIAKRNDAKLVKDYSKADEIRNTLLNMGVSLKDSKEGTSWSKI